MTLRLVKKETDVERSSGCAWCDCGRYAEIVKGIRMHRVGRKEVWNDADGTDRVIDTVRYEPCTRAKIRRAG